MRCYIQFVEPAKMDCGFSFVTNFVGNALVLVVAGIALTIIGSSIASSTDLGTCATTILTTVPASVAIVSAFAAITVTGLFIYMLWGADFRINF